MADGVDIYMEYGAMSTGNGARSTDMNERNSGRARRLLAGRADRRRLLGGLVAGLSTPLAAAWMNPLPTQAQAQEQEGATVEPQRDRDVATVNTLDVPGASLHYEVAGSGPVLLLIPGGALDADSYAFVVEPLAAHYTVVRYDPRGISRSPLAGPPADVPVARHADDAALLLAALGDEPAFVFGSSGGAVIGLDLATRHPDRVRALVAHEPPIEALLPEDSPYRGGSRAIVDAYRAEGIEAAMGLFFATAGMAESEPPTAPSPEMEAATDGAEQNFEFFIAHYLLPITSYQPDLDALRSGSPRVVAAVGAETVGQETHITGRALGDRLGSEAIVFPGDHIGYVGQAAAFAAELHAVLSVG
jgi:pimeloyl-ACP methyl ester carboxylesterase